jgi:hypothetical protein
MSEKKLRGLLGLEQKLSGRQQPSLYRDVPGEFNSINQGLLNMLPMGGMTTGLKRGSGRDWPDVKLADRREGLSEKFLEHHGYRYSSTSGKPDTYTYDKDGKIKAYSHILRKDKWGVEVKTFNNPTLKSLRDWMGY